MPTFLTTPRMHPALAERVAASVQGTRSVPLDPGATGWRPGRVLMARVAAVVAMVLLFIGIATLRRRDQRELEHGRAALLDAVGTASAPLSSEDVGAVERMELWLMRSAGSYEGDMVVDELRKPGALAALLARPAVYVRGTIAQMRTPGGIAEAAASSIKDPLLACLIDPPAGRTEPLLLPKVREAYAGDPHARMTNVQRMRDVQVGLPYLSPRWIESIRKAKSTADLEALREQFEHAPIEAARRAAKAGLLVFAMDEPGEAGTATELDGERPHQVRMGMVDLVSSKVLLRMQRRVDPSWISESKRSLYASGLDACVVGLEVQAAVTK
jgi:hypothetical protein